MLFPFLALAFMNPVLAMVLGDATLPVKKLVAGPVSRDNARLAVAAASTFHGDLNVVYPAYAKIQNMIATQGVEKVDELVASKVFRDTFQDQENAIALYKAFVPGEHANSKFVSELKDIAFNRNIPETLTSVTQVLQLGNLPLETLEFAVKTKAYQEFISDPARLQSLMETIREVGSVSATGKWMAVIPELRETKAFAGSSKKLLE